MRQVISALSLFALLLTASGSATGCKENQEKLFNNLEAAKAQGMIEKGWIPEFIPSDARRIRLAGDLDSAFVYGLYVTDNLETVRSHCSNEGTVNHEEMPQWFPTDLKETNDVAILRSRGYEVRSCGSGETTVAIVPAKNEVFYWIGRIGPK